MISVDIAVIVRITRSIDLDSAGHAHDVTDTDFLTGVTRLLPFGYGRGLPEFIGPLLNQDTHERAGQTLRH